MRETSTPALCRNINDCVLRQVGSSCGTATKAHLFFDSRTKILDQMKPVSYLSGLRCASAAGQRMSWRGNCHDCAVAESFFNLLKRVR